MIWIINIFVFSSFFFKYGAALFQNDFGINSMIKNDESLNKLTTEKSIQLPVDQFNSSDKRTWNMRYFENLKYFKNNGPIIFQMGRDYYDIEPYYDFCVDLAKVTNGALYKNEHRYYGESYPLEVNDYRDFGNYTYLSARQSLADVAALLTMLKKRPEYKHSKVVAVGGSYGGNLAAWMRKMYPDLVDAAHASSAPVLAKVDFPEFMEQVSQDLFFYCRMKDFEKIRNLFAYYEYMLKTDENQFKEYIQEHYNMCKDVDLHKPFNLDAIINQLIGSYQDMAVDGSPESIKKSCSNIWLSARGPTVYVTPVDPRRLTPKMCVPCSFETDVEATKSGPDSWFYQQCNEFGYFQTLSSDAQVFTNHLSLEYFFALCREVFGPDFGEERVKRGVASTNSLYGGLTPNVTRVVFVNGDMDPWSRLGITKDLSPEAPARFLLRTSNCGDLRHSNQTEVIKVQEFSKKMIKKWIGL